LNYKKKQKIICNTKETDLENYLWYQRNWSIRPWPLC